MGDGIRSQILAALNPKRVFYYGASPIGRHYGFLDVNIFPDPMDPSVWKATFRQAWIDPAWADDNSLNPVGGYYDDVHPEAYFEASASATLSVP